MDVTNDNIRVERRTNFSLEGVKFPTATIDVMKRGEALANFERERELAASHPFSTDFQSGGSVCRGASGRSERALEIYRRVDSVTNSY